MPVASTIANSVSVLIVKPKSSRPAKAPISDTGTAMIGISVARQLCRNTNTTSSTSVAASSSVMITSWIDDSHEAGRVERDDLSSRPAESSSASPADAGAHRVGDLERVAAGLQVDGDADASACRRGW